ncbi:innexin inx2-like [Sitodiplosis mosellana]|uniref:innexin inx2-like n=1 Tax=Sitodiplosis mosellana TaxID=263140 RepID=UPI002444F945|nr:innexin inx2-like [Sitodiplosis mosellana]
MFFEINSIKQLFEFDDVCIDDFAFRLHYKSTIIILIISSLFITSNQFIGEPISCIIDDIPANFINSYCWTYGTFTNAEQENGDIQPGVGSVNKGKSEIKYHKYYQWIYFTLLIQAILFYVPRYVWKIWEGGKMQKLSSNLNLVITEEGYKFEGKEIIINYMKKNMGTHNDYALRFLLCLVLNLINIIAQLYFMDYFLNGEFSTYGLEVLKFINMEPEERVDPMSLVFPSMTKCSFNKYGPSGSIQYLDGLCVLPLNALNEIIYIFLWYWFHLVVFFTAVSIVYHILIYVFPYILMTLSTNMEQNGCSLVGI